MNKKLTLLIGLLAMSAMGAIFSILIIFYGDYNGHVAIGIVLFIINGIGVVGGIVNVQRALDEREISIKELDKLTMLGLEEDGTYSDRWLVSLVPEPRKRRWSFCHFDESDGKLTHIRYVNTMKELKETFEHETGDKLS